MLTNALKIKYHQIIPRLLVMLALATSTVACTTQKKISFQALTPALLTLPSHIGQVCILNHTIRPATDSNGVLYGFGGELYYDSASYDTLLSHNLLEGMREGLGISGRLPATEALFLPRGSDARISAVQSFETLGQVCDTGFIDGAIVAEAISAFDYLDYFAFNDGLFVVRLTIAGAASFRLYDLRQQRVIDRVTLTDTLVYENIAFGWDRALRPIPSRTDVYADMAWRLGQRYASRISPGLATHNRTYFLTNNSEMTKGHEYAQQGLWATAARHWIIPAQGKNQRKAAFAAYNMALASEMEGKLDIAIFWIDKSLEKKESAQAFQYKSQLEARQKEIEQLMRQMSIQ